MVGKILNAKEYTLYDDRILTNFVHEKATDKWKNVWQADNIEWTNTVDIFFWTCLAQNCFFSRLRNPCHKWKYLAKELLLVFLRVNLDIYELNDRKILDEIVFDNIEIEFIDIREEKKVK